MLCTVPAGSRFLLALVCRRMATQDLRGGVDRADELAQACEIRIKESGGALQLVQRRAPFNVCFWWVPAQLRPYTPEQATPAAKDLLSKVGLAPCTQPCGSGAPLAHGAPCCHCRVW